jgi:valyl-tRNA synthetase
MRGKEVFYPVGWDDNGLPTERRVQNYFGVSCDPSLRESATGSSGARVAVSRRNFVELCRQLTEVDERAYERAWRQLGLSVDWSMSYRTIDDRQAAVSQRAFLRNIARGEAYSAEGPVLWDVTFQTAVAQAEIEEREVPGTYWRLAFRTGEAAAPDTGPVSGGQELIVATTRPELLPGCVALIAHPDDERYAGFLGGRATTPLFGVQVPILAHRLADPAKGTGLAMVCTFGDTTDVIWWRDLRLATRPVIGQDGRLLPGPPPGITSPAGRAAYAQLAGRTVRAARQRATELLDTAGGLRGEPTPIRHAVKFYEKGEVPLEIVTTRQWYIKNGALDPGLRDALLARGRELDWHPPHMRSRYENWVTGLTGDWLVSRQRFFGVPIPVWYPLDAAAQPRYGTPLLPPDGALPVDPATDPAPGYRPDQRGMPHGFTADPDVMDTWATSSLTPLTAGGWSTDDDLFRRVFPMDLRPQAHEIIRTWLFYTVLRIQDELGVLPWSHAAISGWILDPDRKKMSKSVGNVVTPADLFRDYGTDAVRYWAASARLGVDATFDPAQLKIGRRLAVKVLNAGRFVLGLGRPGSAPGAEQITAPLDRALLSRLADVAAQCTAAFEAYDHASALEQAEHFCWLFCDDYLELVKPRAYGEHGDAAAGSAIATLDLALSVLLRLFAPVLPFVTEEVWSWRPRQAGQHASIHRAAWPDPGELRALGGPDGAPLDAAVLAITSVRRAKSQARLPMRATVRGLLVRAAADQLDALAAVLPDVQAAGRIGSTELSLASDGEPVLEVTL